MIIVGSDHTGFELKKNIIEYLLKKNYNVLDINEEYENAQNIQNTEDVCNIDYPDIAYILSKKVLEKKENIGIAICGTGIGISISCNKVKNIRAALCTDEYMSKMAKEHNNANVICFGARLESTKDIKNVYKMIDAFIESSFEGKRHERRIEKISKIEEKEGI